LIKVTLTTKLLRQWGATIGTWVKQLQQERKGVRVEQTPITPDQLEIKDLKKKLARAELEKEILKKATALLMSDSMNNSP
jgi:transposase